jgi:class 3 adenylate cyclase
VSGFTALSERLQMQSSTDGADNMTTIMNEFFARMLEIISSSDGMLLKFAGDALLAFFPAQPNDHGAADAIKAVRTGLRMQRAMAAFQPISAPQLLDVLQGIEASLTMSIGIARGQLFEACIGNAVQREHLIQGALPYLAMEAEAIGTRDDVIVTADLAPLLSSFTLRHLSEGFIQVIDDLGASLGDYEFEVPRRRRAKSSAIFLEPDNVVENLRALVTRIQTVARYISPAVLHGLVTSGVYRVHSENRPTTTLFIYVDGFSELLTEWGESRLSQIASMVERYYNLIHQIATANGGAVTRTDPYKHGIKLLITYGALISHEDDPHRAVASALEMTHALAHFNLRLQQDMPPDVSYVPQIVHRIGITQGNTFSGEVGWKARREYTVMGDEVNLAARLMARADPNQILISERVQRRVSSFVLTTASEAMHLKGKSVPIRPYIVVGELGESEAPEERTPLVGHDLVVHTLSLELRRTLDTKQPVTAALIAESGSGKSRVAREIVRQAEALEYRVVWVTCHPRSSRRTTWDQIVSTLLEIDSKETLERQRQQLRNQLQRLQLSELEPALSLLCFGAGETTAAEPDTGLDVDGEPKGERTSFRQRFENIPLGDRKSGIYRYAKTKLAERDDSTARPGLWARVQQRLGTPEAVARLLQRLSENKPLLIVIDDLHHESANALPTLRHLAANPASARLMVMLTWELSNDLDLPVQRIIVPDLTYDETRRLAMTILHTADIGERLSQFLWERTGGRPLFVESLVRSLDDGGQIDRDPFTAELKPNSDVNTLPENVRELMISRFDRLPSDAQVFVRAAAVMSHNFPLEGVWALVGQSGERTTLNPASAIQNPVLAQLFEQNSDGTYCFRHPMMREAVYVTLTRAQRLKLHHTAANFWRGQPPSHEQVIALAYHLGRSGLLPQALEAVTNAADDALAAGDFDGAVDIYSRALELFPDDKNIRLHLERLTQQQ